VVRERPRRRRNAWACDVNETLMRQTIDAFVTLGLRDAGFEYVSMDGELCLLSICSRFLYNCGWQTAGRAAAVSQTITVAAPRSLASATARWRINSGATRMARLSQIQSNSAMV
jgi:hypothetical protein